MVKIENQSPSREPIQFDPSASQAVKYWILMLVLWFLFYLETRFIIDIINNWQDPYYVTSFPFGKGRLGEIIAFALVVVMALYTVGSTFLIFIYLIRNRFKNINYRALARMHTLVLSSFIVWWLIFMAVFYRP